MALTLDKLIAAKKIVDDIMHETIAHVSSSSSLLGSLKIVESNFMYNRVQVRFPRSKSKRIRRKWAKRESSYKNIPIRDVYVMGDKMICSPEVAVTIRREVSRG